MCLFKRLYDTLACDFKETEFNDPEVFYTSVKWYRYFN